MKSVLLSLIVAGTVLQSGGIKSKPQDGAPATFPTPPDMPPNEVQPPLGNSAPAPTEPPPAEQTLGAIHRHEVASGRHSIRLLTDENGNIEEFQNCSQACDRCFHDNYQSCIAHCRKGCATHCDDVLPEAQCKSQSKPSEVWIAEIGSIFDLLTEPGQICQLNSPDKCAPERKPPPDAVTSAGADPWANKHESQPASAPAMVGKVKAPDPMAGKGKAHHD
eukprot:TRINITY_DN89829_c0_g1_i1.p1 TRINITY_DN89829_c0_g1~~TRINITY_DN89829_c0_g1_i1.p1  ORF type:complete len:220 (-),score=43.74 TRINITY_DN89829_c0_g1_i1:96-755(-)